jgi:ankyrin repeat protein
MHTKKMSFKQLLIAIVLGNLCFPAMGSTPRGSKFKILGMEGPKSDDLEFEIWGPDDSESDDLWPEDSEFETWEIDDAESDNSESDNSESDGESETESDPSSDANESSERGGDFMLSGENLANDLLEQRISQVFFDSDMTAEEGLKMIKTLVEEKNLSVDFKCNGDNALLHLASANPDRLAIVQYLLEKGANREIKDAEEYAPLACAAIAGNVEAVRLLIDNGANVNTTAENNLTPLHLAVAANSPEIIQMFIHGGANVNAKDNDGETPLDTARTMNDNEEIIGILLQASSH